MKIAVVTDSTAFLSDETKSNENLFVVPIPVILDGKIYNEGIDIEANEYYELLNNSQEFPTTSQPAMGEVLELYHNLAKKGYDQVISIHLSSGISGFVTNLSALSSTVEDITVHPFDSLITSAPMGHMVEVALEMSESGANVTEILERLSVIREYTSAYMIVDDLNNLVRGGRLTNGAAVIGSLLKIKPILNFEKGKIVVFEKIRSSKKAYLRVAEELGNKTAEINLPLRYFVIHANNLEVAEAEKAALLAKYPGIDISISHFGPVIGSHLGEKAIGIAWAPK